MIREIVSSHPRECVLALLAAGYVSLSALVYSDEPTAERGPVLGDLAAEGRGVWMRYNCQACHQIHGFGGFLGPDLTNRIDDSRPDAEFRELLVSGYRRMPALGLSGRERSSVLAFLRAVGTSGVARPRPLGEARPLPPPVHFERLVASWAEGLPDSARAGADVWTRHRCGSCHLPFATGPSGAPDLSAGALELSPETLAGWTARPGRGMPAYRLTEEEIQCLWAFLEWIRSNRTRLVRANAELTEKETFDWTRVPWFEFF